MSELSWLVGRRFESLTRRESDWVFAFGGEVHLTVECLWRLIEAGTIRLTSEDDGHQFGLPAPIHATVEVNSRLAGSAVDEVHIREGTLDLSLKLSTGQVLEFIPTSAGYESWNLGCGDQFYVATGGGRLTVFDDVGSPRE